MDKRFPVEDQIAMLGSALKGRLVMPGSPDYDALRQVVPANYDRRPAALIRVADAADIAAALGFARATDLPLAIRSGGHSAHSSTEGGLVIDLRDLNGIAIDPVARTAWAGTGLTAGELTSALEPHGLVIGFGDTASVGIGGITLGGGVGYMVRKFGLTIDNVLAAEVVTADGRILIADEHNHADLFWALRGGGGNFGVVTRWKYRLQPLPEFTGGPLVLPATPEVVAKFVELAAAAPDELTAIATVMPALPLPFIPEAMHGQVVFFAMMAFAGPDAAAEKALRPFRELATPIADLVGPMPYPGMYNEHEERMAFSVRSRLLSGFGREAAATVIEHIRASDAPLRLGEIRVLGGAFGRVAPEATAFAHRDARVMVSFIAASETATSAKRHDAWATEAVAALPAEADRVYVNFLTSDPEERKAAAYPPATWARLLAVKRQYDPENLFRLNQNVC